MFYWFPRILCGFAPLVWIGSPQCRFTVLCVIHNCTKGNWGLYNKTTEKWNGNNYMEWLIKLSQCKFMIHSFKRCWGGKYRFTIHFTSIWQCSVNLSMSKAVSNLFTLVYTWQPISLNCFLHTKKMFFRTLHYFPLLLHHGTSPP